MVVRQDFAARAVVVVDEAQLLTAVWRMLHELGVDAVPATCCAAGRHAAAVLGDIDLLVADVELPDGNGLALAAELALKHGVRTVVIGAYGPPADDALPPDVGAWLAKPVDLGALRDAVCKLLPETAPVAAAP